MYSFVLISTLKPIFKISFYSEIYGAKLYPDLMMPACKKLNLQQVVFVNTRNMSISKSCIFGSWGRFIVCIAFISFLYLSKIMFKRVFMLRWAFINNRPISFCNLITL